MSRKKFRAPSYVKRDETHLGIKYHSKMTLLLFTCSSHPRMIEIWINDKHSICFKKSFIPRWVLNFYSHDNFLHFCPWMGFHPCQDSDEIILRQNFTLGKTCEYNGYFDQRQGWIPPEVKLVPGWKSAREGTFKWKK